MYSKRELKAQMARAGMTQKDLAESIGIAVNTMCNKMSDGNFSRKEISDIMGALDINDPRPIFFADEVT